MPAHANGYACVHSFHLFIIVYIYAGLELYTPPFSRSDPIKAYITPGYKPIVVWLLTSVYEILSILLEKNRKHVLLFGFTSNKWWKSILRGFVLSLGMWAFYLGLGLGVLFFQTSWYCFFMINLNLKLAVIKNQFILAMSKSVKALSIKNIAP